MESANKDTVFIKPTDFYTMPSFYSLNIQYKSQLLSYRACRHHETNGVHISKFHRINQYSPLDCVMAVATVF